MSSPVSRASPSSSSAAATRPASSPGPTSTNSPPYTTPQPHSPSPPPARTSSTNWPVSPSDALRWGLADAIATNEAELRKEYEQLLLRAVAQGKRRRDKLPLRTWRQRLLESNPFGRRLILRGTERLLRNRVPDDMPA